MTNKIKVEGKGQISATVIADSRSGKSLKRIVTLQLTYPRFILAEVNTHRVFSRNSASSRAIPVKKIIEQVRTNPAMPIHWGRNKPGMQADEELSLDEIEHMKKLWIESANIAADQAEKMLKLEGHKQFVNRILEPYQFMHTILTSTEWRNFFELRNHKDAQPEFKELASVMQLAMDKSESECISKFEHQWHLPYVTDEEKLSCSTKVQLCISVARCCRVSYNKHDGSKATVDEDISLHDKLLISKPMHSSPGEHQARPVYDTYDKEFTGNFKEWVQYRKLLEMLSS